MANICCAWELGGGLGHISSLAVLGNEFEKNGHDVVYILKDTSGIALFINNNSGIYAAPRADFIYRGKYKPILNYTEILIHRGYINEEILFGLCRSWRNLLIANRVDLLLVDHSPTAMLAACSLGIRCVSIGTGFASPPRVSPFPVFRDIKSKDSNRITQSEDDTLRIINRVLARLDTPALQSVADLFETPALDVLTTFRELDVYPDRIEGDYLGPLSCKKKPDDQAVVWPHVFDSRIFVYLKKNYKYLESVLLELSTMNADFLIYIEGYKGSSDWSSRFNHMVFADKPLDLDRVLKESSATVCHAGHGLVIKSLLQGIPLIMLPMVQEQGLNAGRVEELKAGVSLTMKDGAGRLTSNVNQVLNDETSRKHALIFATRYKNFNHDAALEDIIRQCEGLI